MKPYPDLTDKEVRKELVHFRREYAKALDFVCIHHLEPFPPKPLNNDLFAVDTLIHELEKYMNPPTP